MERTESFRQRYASQGVGVETITYLKIDNTMDWVDVAVLKKTILQPQSVAGSKTHRRKHKMFIVAIGTHSHNLVVNNWLLWILENDAELFEDIGRRWSCWKRARKGASNEARRSESLEYRRSHHDCDEAEVRCVRRKAGEGCL